MFDAPSRDAIVRDTIGLTLRKERGVVTLGGVIVVSDDTRPMRLMLRGDGFEQRLDFLPETPRRLTRKHPEARNANSGRIRAQDFPLHRLPLHLFLEGEDGGAPVYLRSLDLPDLIGARHLALVEIYADSAPEIRKADLYRRLLRLIPEGASQDIRARCRIWLYRIFGAKHGRTRGLMATVKALMARNGNPAGFDAFERGLANKGFAMVAPHSADAFLGKKDSRTLWTTYDALAGRLEGMGLRVFLNSGTLLGAVRDGDFLPHDDDIDVAVILDARSEEEAGAEFAALAPLLHQAGLLDPEGTHPPGLHKLSRVDGVQVDLFPCWIDDADRVHVYPHSHGTLHRDDLLPLQPFKGLAHARMPARPEPMLHSNYGPGWRVPDPHFRFLWAEPKRRFARFLAACQEPGAGLTPDRMHDRMPDRMPDRKQEQDA